MAKRRGSSLAAAATSRALLAKEINLVSRTNSGCDLRVHLSYPNSYWVGMSNLGFQAVYAIFAEQQGIMVERAFLPEGADQYRNDSAFRTLEGGRVLSDCDVLGFSLSFETDYPHMFRMLKSQGLLEPCAERRAEMADEMRMGHPLIIAGGTAVTLNPEPVAEYVDAVVIGEAEELLVELIEVLRRARRQGLSRTDTLLLLAQVEGVYVPRFYRAYYSLDHEIERFESDERVPPRARRRVVKDISRFPTYSKVLTPNTEFSSMFLTETGRGCEVGCRFCVAGYIYRPVRKRSEESIAQSVELGLKNSQAIGFVGAAVSSHKSIAKLASGVAQSGARASLSSLMSQRVTRELAASLSESEYKTVALAPEAGTERLRFAAGKRVRNEQVVEAARQLAEHGIRGFKLYFIVGLPTEEERDIDAIAQLARAVRDAVVEMSPHPGSVWVALSVNPFIPKACTPFQWEPMLERRELEGKIDRLRKLLRGVANIEFRFEPPKESYFQALLSRGDRRVGKLLYYLEENKLDWKWLVSRSSKQVLPDVPALDFFVKRRIAFDRLLPWEIVDSRIERDLLRREALRAHAAVELGELEGGIEACVPAELI